MLNPYEGNKPYIFINYCHDDKQIVYPYIEAFMQKGYRVWYDDGLHPGDDWPEVIAQHISNSTICVTFMTNNAVNSHNCRKEINFAFMQNKTFIGVELEVLQMSLGLQMQMSTIQFIKYGTYQNKDELFAKFDDVELFQLCKEEPQVQYYLNRCNHNDIIEIKDEIRIGRSKARSNFIVLGNDTIGRHHATIKYKDGILYLRDEASLNKTYLNGEELKPHIDYEITETDSIHLSDEQFIIKKVKAC